MTDNIQKLYEVAGVEKLVEQWYNASIYGTIENCIEMAHKWSKENGIKIKNLTVLNDEKICFDKVYHPPFTAEKQIAIIKFLIGKHASFGRSKNYKQKDLYMVYYECRYFPKQYLPFEEALAESINYLWQDLTEDEKTSIKEILGNENF